MTARGGGLPPPAPANEENPNANGAAVANLPIAHHWKKKFAEMASQLDEIEGKAPAKAPDDDRDATQDRLAAKEPAMNVRIENKTVALNYRNLSEVTVNYYPMDLEFLFSANPFVTQDTSRFRMIRPNKSEKVMLPAGQETHVFALPKEYQSANVLVEVTGGGLTKAEAAYANELDVQVSEGFGRLQVQPRRRQAAAEQSLCESLRRRERRARLLQRRLHRPAREVRLRQPEHRRPRCARRASASSS